MKKVSGKEFAWYVAGGIFAIGGIALIIFGIIGSHMSVALADNFIKSAEEALINAIKVPFDFRVWGIILLALGMLIVVLTLNYNAKKADREIEKTIRRQQRLNAGVSSTVEVKSAVKYIEEEPAVETKSAPSNDEAK